MSKNPKPSLRPPPPVRREKSEEYSVRPKTDKK